MRTLPLSPRRPSHEDCATIPTPRVPPSGFGELVEQVARTHDVDPLLVHSMIQVESNYNRLRGFCPKGAEGWADAANAIDGAHAWALATVSIPGQNIEAGSQVFKISARRV